MNLLIYTSRFYLVASSLLKATCLSNKYLLRFQPRPFAVFASFSQSTSLLDNFFSIFRQFETYFWMAAFNILSSVFGLCATICAVYTCVSPYWAVSVKNSNGFNEMQERYFGLWQYCAGGDHYGTVKISLGTIIFISNNFIIKINNILHYPAFISNLVSMPSFEPIRNRSARSIWNCWISHSRYSKLYFRKRRIHRWRCFFWFCQSGFFKSTLILIKFNFFKNRNRKNALQVEVLLFLRSLEFSSSLRLLGLPTILSRDGSNYKWAD